MYRCVVDAGGTGDRPRAERIVATRDTLVDPPPSRPPSPGSPRVRPPPSRRPAGAVARPPGGPRAPGAGGPHPGSHRAVALLVPPGWRGAPGAARRTRPRDHDPPGAGVLFPSPPGDRRPAGAPGGRAGGPPAPPDRPPQPDRGP